MHRLLKLVMCFPLLFNTTNLQSRGWRGIVPLQSTRAEVESKLGRAMEGAERYAAYNFENEAVIIWYATTACGGKNSSGWNVPRGTVVEVTLSPTKVMKLAELHLDLVKFKREVNDHFPDESFYGNAKEGFGVVTIRGKISALRYYPSESQNHLRCNADDKQKNRRESSPTELTSATFRECASGRNSNMTIKDENTTNKPEMMPGQLVTEFKELTSVKGTTKDGAPYSAQIYESPDGVRVSVTRENRDSAKAAAKELKKRIKQAIEIVERGPKLDETGQRVW